MAQEIERKFLVKDDRWRSLASGVKYAQGYIPRGNATTVRVRIAGKKAYLTIKSPVIGITRAEYEYPIPLQDAEEMLANLCDHPIIEKYRYAIPWGDLVWEVDEFLGDNLGLVIAEVELTHEGQQFELPPWIDREVHDARYRNAALVNHPYCAWTKEEKG
jgi:CYTH domain-containing protein